MTDTTAGTDYDQVVELYTELFTDELTQDPPDGEVLAEFIRVVSQARHRRVADLGCGPGHVTAHLHTGGLEPFGIDLSRQMVLTARRREPHLGFCQSDLRSVPVRAQALSGVAARYSFIHLPPASLPAAFAECERILAPNGHFFLSFFAVAEADRHGEAFDHAASRAYFLHPDTVAELANRHGLELVTRHVRPQRDGERSDQAALLFHKR